MSALHQFFPPTSAEIIRDGACTDPQLLDRLARQSTTRLVLVDSQGRVCVETENIYPDLPQDGLTPADSYLDARKTSAAALPRLTASEYDLSKLNTFYLGAEANGTNWLAVVLESRQSQLAVTPHLPQADLASYQKTPLRAVKADLNARDAHLATAAVALAAWHANAAYCCNCGAPTKIIQAGWVRRCTSCAEISFPRTDPAVIMSVIDESDRIALVHATAWRAQRYSVVSGFIEAGESAEAAVVREVAEETGLRVGKIAYVTSQPWPFPRSLMFGYCAYLQPGKPLARPDGVEIDEVRFFSRAELAAELARGDLLLPGRASLAHTLIQRWYAQPL